MKKFLAALLSLVLIFSLASASLAEDEPTVIRIGATPSPHAEVLELVKDDLAALGYTLEIIEFTDYPLPNPALAGGELEANFFQHLSYQKSYNSSAAEADQIVEAFVTHYEPFCIYKGKCDSIENLPDGATITITNDPSNETRALLLLQSAGLITLPDGTDPYSSVTVLDIVGNPKNLNILEVDAATLPATLEDADLAVINGNFAIGAGLSITENAVFVEPSDSPSITEAYANCISINPEDLESDWVKALKQVLLSDKVRDFMNTSEKYAGGVIPMF